MDPDRPRFGLDHVTVVPSNFEPESPRTGEERAGPDGSAVGN